MIPIMFFLWRIKGRSFKDIVYVNSTTKCNNVIYAVCKNNKPLAIIIGIA